MKAPSPIKIPLKGKVMGLNNLMRIPPIRKIKPKARIPTSLWREG
jgi:hypothetical protein